MHITESKIRQMVREAIINEISQQTKAGGFVKANNDIETLRKMKNSGQRTFTKNGRLADIDNEIGRRERQMKTFGNGLSHDLSMEYGKDRDTIQHYIDRYKENIKSIKSKIAKIENGEIQDYDGYRMRQLKDDLKRNVQSYKKMLTDPNGYSVNTLGNDGYSIQTPDGRAYSTISSNGIQYDNSHNDNSNVNRLNKLQGITDAMVGYDDELSGKMDKDIDNMRRRQHNVQALRDYDDAYSRWEQGDKEIKQAQYDYDRQPFFKKWFSKRPADSPQAPTKPTWKPNENGQFDGYFAHTNPADYEDDINDVSTRQQHYRDARKKYFK